MSLDFDLEPEFIDIYQQCRSETLTSIERMYALYKAVEHVVQMRIQGDFVECGVWRGGSVMMMALAARHFGDTQRCMWLYDTFSGMTAPSSADIQAITGRSAQDVLNANEKNETNPFWAVASRDVVKANKLTMEDKNGKEHSHDVVTKAKITCDGKECKLIDLKPGTRIRVTTDDENRATRIEAFLKTSESKKDDK